MTSGAADHEHGQDSASQYRFEWTQDGSQQRLDVRGHWVGMVNHLPMPHCNLRLTENGKRRSADPSKKATR